MNIRDIRFRGMYLRSEIEWLLRHAKFDENGICRCVETNKRISSNIVHRFRAKDAGYVAPFIPHSTPGEGELVTYTTLWCTACGMHQNTTPEVRLTDLVTIVDGEGGPPS